MYLVLVHKTKAIRAEVLFGGLRALMLSFEESFTAFGLAEKVGADGGSAPFQLWRSRGMMSTDGMQASIVPGGATWPSGYSPDIGSD